MARFYGAVGFAISEEVKPGIFQDVYVERYYKGDVTRRSHSWNPSEYINDNLTVTNDISIIADSFANSNFGCMRYVRWMKQVFEITSAQTDLERHRITLSLGGVFNVPSDD